MADFTALGRAAIDDYAQALVLFSCWRRLGDSVSVSFNDALAGGSVTMEGFETLIERLGRESPIFADQKALILKVKPDLLRLMAMARSFPLEYLNTELFQEAFALTGQGTRFSVTPGFHIPSSVFRLMWGVAGTTSKHSVYLPAWGDFRWLPADVSFSADNFWLGSRFWAAAWSILSGNHLEFAQRSFLRGPSDDKAPHQRKQFDVVLSVPPFGIRVQPNELFDDSSRLYDPWIQNRPTNADLIFWMMAMAHAPKAVIVSPLGCLFRVGYEVGIRKHLIESGFVRAVVELPGSFMEVSSVSLALVVLARPNGNVHPTHIVFADATSIIEIEKRRMVFSQQGIDDIVDLVEGQLTREGVSAKIRLEEVAAQDFILTPRRYLQDKKQRADAATLASFGTVTLGAIVDIINPQLPTATLETKGSLVREIRVSDFPRAGSVDIEVVENCKMVEVDLSSERIRRNLLRPWDVILSTKGTVGKVALIGQIEGHMALASQTCHILRVSQGADRELSAKALFMYLRSTVGQGQIEPLVTKSTLSHLSAKALSGLQVPVFSRVILEKSNEDFRKEAELVRQIEQLEAKISEIHSGLGQQVQAVVDDIQTRLQEIEDDVGFSVAEASEVEKRNQK